MTFPAPHQPAWGPLALALWVGACTLQPTPYQPLGDAGGYEESRLQPDVYRVSFKGNRATPETAVIDYLYLRCAELTLAADFPYFVILENFGRTRTEYAPRSGVGLGVGVGSYSRGSFWNLGVAGGTRGDDLVLSYHLAVFVIRMLPEGEAKKDPNAFAASYLVKSLSPKTQQPSKAKS